MEEPQEWEWPCGSTIQYKIWMSEGIRTWECEYTEQVDTQPDELTKSSGFLFLSRGSSLYELVSIAGRRIRKDTNNR